MTQQQEEQEQEQQEQKQQQHRQQQQLRLITSRHQLPRPVMCSEISKHKNKKTNDLYFRKKGMPIVSAELP